MARHELFCEMVWCRIPSGIDVSARESAAKHDLQGREGFLFSEDVAVIPVAFFRVGVSLVSMPSSTPDPHDPMRWLPSVTTRTPATVMARHLAKRPLPLVLRKALPTRGHQNLSPRSPRDSRGVEPQRVAPGGKVVVVRLREEGEGAR